MLGTLAPRAVPFGALTMILSIYSVIIIIIRDFKNTLLLATYIHAEEKGLSVI